MEDKVRQIASAYGRSVEQVAAAQKGYRNSSYALVLRDGSTANLIIFKAESGMLEVIRRANAVSLWAAAQDAGLPVRLPLDRRIACLTTSASGDRRYAGIYTYLPGTTIPWEAYTMDHLKSLGQTMSRLHQALQQYDGPMLPPVHEQYGQIVERMLAYYAQAGVTAAMQRKLSIMPPVPGLEDARATLALCGRLPDQQALHMDFVRGNILFAPGTTTISGILDFEKTACGHRIFDIARTLAFLLADCTYKSERQVRKYFLISGYARRGPLPLPRIQLDAPHGRRDLLESLIDMFLLYDLYKFMRHNPYESLAANHHYRRTRDLLQARGLIQSLPAMVR